MTSTIGSSARRLALMAAAAMALTVLSSPASEATADCGAGVRKYQVYGSSTGFGGASFAINPNANYSLGGFFNVDNATSILNPENNVNNSYQYYGGTLYQYVNWRNGPTGGGTSQSGFFAFLFCHQ